LKLDIGVTDGSLATKLRQNTSYFIMPLMFNELQGRVEQSALEARKLGKRASSTAQAGRR
jgi:hypothetical protein